VIIGTAGHIDHGKTSLVKAITGVDADRLKEEKARGITIDLGFAYWPQADGSTIGFVDVPGHESYIHNMLAGVTGIGALMLVIAANDGVKPQTREHLMIADMLGLSQGVVALTKIDLVSEVMVSARSHEIRTLLAGTGLRDVQIVPLSTRTGRGIDVLKIALQDIQLTVSPRENSPFRMPIDRVFSVQGAGTVVTGAVLSGMVETDDKLLLSPSGQEVRVRGIHAQGEIALHSSNGERAALNLAGVGKDDTQRGEVLLHPTLHNPTTRFDASIRLMDAEIKSLAPWTLVHLHCGTGAWTARTVSLTTANPTSGKPHLVQLVLDRPAALFGGDQFIIRDASAQRTLGGGTVLDIEAPERNRRKPDRLHVLELIHNHGAVDALPYLLEVAPFAVEMTAFARKHALEPKAFDAIIARNNLLQLPAEEGRFVFSAPSVLKFSRDIQRILAAHHTAYPDQVGLAQQRLRLTLSERLEPDPFVALVAHLTKRGEIAAVGTWVRLVGHVPRLSAEHEALWEQIFPLLSGDNRFKPPRINELAEHLQRRDETLRGLMKRLARRGDVNEVAADHYLLRSAIGELAQTALRTGRESADGWFNAAAFRNQLGTGRKMAILILEFFDRQGVTFRKGDMRKVVAAKASMFQSELV
jgi:selenocysteine-specific elongation factor